MREGERPPLEHVVVALRLNDGAVGGGQFPILLRPRAPVLEHEPRAVSRSRDLLDDVGHRLEVVVVVAHDLRGGVPPLEVLRAVDPHPVRAEIHLAALHLQEDRSHRRVPVVEVLAVHVGPGEPMAVERPQPLVVGVPEHHVEDQPLRAGRKRVERGGEVHQLVRAARLQQRGVHRRHARDHHVVAPVRRVGAVQVHGHRAVARLALDPEVWAGLVDGGGLHRQQLHRVVAEEERVGRLQGEVALDPLGQAPVAAGQTRQGAVRRRGGDVDLEDVRRRADLARRVPRHRRPVGAVLPRRLHRGHVVEFRRGHRAEGHRHGQRIEDPVPPVVAVAPCQGVEVAGRAPRPGPHPAHGREAMRVLADHGDARPVEPDGLVRAGEVERAAGPQDFEEDVARRHVRVLQLGRPEAEQRDVALHPSAQPPRDGAVGVERGGGGREDAPRGVRLAAGRVLVKDDLVAQRHVAVFPVVVPA